MIELYQHSNRILKIVATDMNRQMEWCMAIKKSICMLKFRLPYYKEDVADTFKYLDGTIYKQCWGPVSTSECRLVVPENKKIIEYNIRKHENQMHRFNTITRQWQYWPHDIDGAHIGLDHCWDCKAEIEILKEYISLAGRGDVISMSNEITLLLSDLFTKSLKTGTHGVFCNTPMEDKYEYLFKMVDLESSKVENNKLQSGRVSK